MRRMKASEAVGTRVRVIQKADKGIPGVSIGDVGAIVRIAEGSYAPVEVAFNDDDCTTALFWRELERVEGGER